MEKNMKPEVETVVLPDGRRAERHVTLDDEGREVIEIFAEEARPLKLERRITKEKREIVAKETTETVKDGAVVKVDVKSVDVDPPLQLREQIATVDHDKVVFGDYVKRDELKAVVADSVVAGVSALVETQAQMQLQAQAAPQPAAPRIRIQEAVGQNIEEKKENDWRTIVWMAVILAVQVGLAIYVVKFM